MLLFERLFKGMTEEKNKEYLSLKGLSKKQKFIKDTLSLLGRYYDLVIEPIYDVVEDSILAKGFDIDDNEFLEYLSFLPANIKLSEDVARIIYDSIKEKKLNIDPVASKWLYQPETYSEGTKETEYKIKIISYLSNKSNYEKHFGKDFSYYEKMFDDNDAVVDYKTLKSLVDKTDDANRLKEMNFEDVLFERRIGKQKFPTYMKNIVNESNVFSDKENINMLIDNIASSERLYEYITGIRGFKNTSDKEILRLFQKAINDKKFESLMLMECLKYFRDRGREDIPNLKKLLAEMFSYEIPLEKIVARVIEKVKDSRKPNLTDEDNEFDDE